MKLLKIELHNTAYFGKYTELNLITTDKVRKIQTDSDDIMRVYTQKISKLNLHTQVLLGITGLNATGKTTIIELLQCLCRIINQTIDLSNVDVNLLFNKLQFNTKNNFKLMIYMTDGNKVYKWIAEIGNRDNKFIYVNEFIYEKSIKNCLIKDLLEFKETDLLKDRCEFTDNPFLKNHISIISLLNANITSSDNIITNNINLPLLQGKQPIELLHCLDKSIKEIEINVDEDDLYEANITFVKDNLKLKYYEGSQVLKILSSGTIKGLVLFDQLLDILKNGGYFIIDEIENHWNKKIVEWIFSLFENKNTNPKGACLIFTTHYPELLDYFVRKDNLYITRRNQDYTIEIVCYANQIHRTELSKGKAILFNKIVGTAPKYIDLKTATEYIKKSINMENNL